MVGEMGNACVRRIEVGRVDSRVVALPGISSFVRASLVKGLHIGIETGHDLD